MKKILLSLMVMILTVSVILAGCGEAEPGDKPLIKLGELNWGSARFQSQMAGIIIEEGYGYPVEIIPGITIPLLQGLRTGDIDVYLEGWLQNQQEAVDTALAAGDIVMLGFLNDDNWQSSFVVPTYIIKGDTARGIEPMAPDRRASPTLPSRSTRSCSRIQRTQTRA